MVVFLLIGIVVCLERDVEFCDFYWWLLVYVYWVGDGVFVNLELVWGGFARVLSILLDIVYVDELGVAVDDVWVVWCGLWGVCLLFGSLVLLVCMDLLGGG